MIFRACVLSAFVLSTPMLCNLAARADEPMKLDARLANPVMKSGETHKNYLRIGLNGCKPDRTDRTPVNVAFVIDRSGSMQGDRIAQAREAAIMAVNRLDGNDIASVVVFDTRVDVLVPAQTVSDPNYFTDRIRQVRVGGSTAIYEGVMQGAGEVRKNKDPRRLNRIVLLSDGLANVGPSRPGDFAALGRNMLAEGISVSTIGLGLHYNEDLMLQLARASDGNHAFASTPTDLIQVFNREFNDVLASCAQMVSIDVELRPGVRVVRALSREGEVTGERARFQLNQVYQATEHYVLLELDVDRGPASEERDFGVVRVEYTAPDTGARQSMNAPIRGRFSASTDEVTASLDNTVMVSVVEQTTRERAQRAVALRDEGKGEEARKLFEQNAGEIRSYLATARRPSPGLQELQGQYENFAKVSPAAPASVWNEQRKVLRQLDANSAMQGIRY